MGEMVKVTIDGRELEFPAGTSLFEACRVARGEALPHFCYHPDLPVAGVCRLCQVEVEGMPKLTIACNTTVRDGMVVHTRSERVRTAVRQILELHLINHPVDCPICDQAGECGLQNQYMEYGLYESEVGKGEKVHKAKAQVIGPHVILDKERCVLCSRCVRFCDHVTGTSELGIFNRGDRAEIGIAPGKELNNNYSLNTVDICPVGALTSRDFRFQKRVWLLRSTPSVCTGCATGCNIRVDHEGGRIWRLKPRRNDAVNGPWMCDMGRMTYRRVHAENRLTAPRLGAGEARRETTWEELSSALAALPGGGLVVVSPHQTLEEMALAAALAEARGAAIVSGPAEADRGEGDDLLLDADRAPNRASLARLGIEELPAARLAERIGAADGPIVLYGGDPVGAAPEVADGCRDRELVYLGTHACASSEAAAIVAPLRCWAEKDGTLINRQGRLQALRRAVAAPEQAREDWRVLDEWLRAVTGESRAGDAAALKRWAARRAGLPEGIDLAALPPEGVLPAGVAPAAGGER